MGADESKTQIQVQNKRYDPARLHHDKHVGEPMFKKFEPPKEGEVERNRSTYSVNLTHSQNSVLRTRDLNANSHIDMMDLDQISMTQVEI
jgi:hypothetical protein